MLIFSVEYFKKRKKTKLIAKMSHHLVMTEKQKQRQIQAEKDKEMEIHIMEWIEKVLHKKPAVTDEENYTKFIK